MREMPFEVAMRSRRLALDVALEDEAVDDGGAGGGCAEAFLAHGLAEFLVIDHLAGAFHRGEERGFVEAGRGLGLALLDLDGIDAGSLSGGDGDEGFALAFHLAAIDFEPAGFDDDLALGLEFLGLDGGDAGRELELGRGEEDGDEAAGDHVVNLRLHLIELLGGDAGGDDGKVIGDLGVIEDALVGVDPAVLEGLRGMAGRGRDRRSLRGRSCVVGM